MNDNNLNWITNFIWDIADDVLRDVYVRGKYRDVILPMSVIRRLDAVLEPTKEAVLAMKAQLDLAGVATQHAALCQAAGEAFYNTSKFKLRDLKARTRQQQLKADFESYLDGFSPNVQEILDKFKFRNQIPTLIEADILGSLIEKFLDASINLSPKPILDANGNVKIPALDNHAMGTIFEELIYRFNAENNEEAGEHFTPRDVVKLMADLIFLPIADKIQSGTYLVYDGACGTGGMLTVAEQRLAELVRDRNKEVSIHLYGQEINPETYAITKADLLLKGEGVEAENMKYGSTLSSDGFPSQEFDFMLSNPPYGKSWKTDLDRLGGKSGIRDPRFVIQHAGEAEFSLITRSSDGQLLFLVNMLSKMKHNSPLGSRIVEVHNGSSLFTGDAGQGESNIRRWILENDWLEAILGLPLNMFYNTGIATYIWVLSNHKPVHRRGKVQLINALNYSRDLRKNLGQKNCELIQEDIQAIIELFLNFEETTDSKILNNEDFGYWKITIERPLRLTTQVTSERMARYTEVADPRLVDLAERLHNLIGVKPHRDWNIIQQLLEIEAKKHFFPLKRGDLKSLREAFTERDEQAMPVIERQTRTEIVYEADPELRDTEKVPLKESIEEYFTREVLPYLADAWINHEKTVKGYEILFEKYFYKYQPLRSLEEITADILALEKETEGLLNRIVAEVEVRS